MIMKKVIGAFCLGIIAASVCIGCGPKYPNCDQDKDCQQGEYCVNNLCQKCRDNGDCPQGQECQAGACRDIEGYCAQSSDCAEGQVCRANRCGPCMEAGDCADGKVCLDGVCQKAECKSNEECPAGLACINYRCQDDPALASQIGAGDCVIENVYFEFDSSDITEDMRKTVEKDYECIAKRGGKVTLVGHCDPRGTTEYNMALGERRAKVVGKMLETLGIDASSMQTSYKGEEEATGTDEASWVKDRKVEFK
jgi:peptidoglycan-associated lipoprotein